jgi:regulatory protein
LLDLIQTQISRPPGRLAQALRTHALPFHYLSRIPCHSVVRMQHTPNAVNFSTVDNMREPRKRAPRRLDAAGLWELALKALAARACSSGELRQKLLARAERLEDVDATLARLKEYRYLDDRRFAENYAAARLENQRLGKNRVTQELRRRRVAPAVAEAAVQRTYRQVDEVVLIEEFIRRKYRGASPADLFQDDKQLASAYRRLVRAGFTSGNVIRALKRFAANPELLDQFEPPAETGEE